MTIVDFWTERCWATEGLYVCTKNGKGILFPSIATYMLAYYELQFLHRLLKNTPYYFIHFAYAATAVLPSKFSSIDLTSSFNLVVYDFNKASLLCGKPLDSDISFTATPHFHYPHIKCYNPWYLMCPQSTRARSCLRIEPKVMVDRWMYRSMS